MNQRKSPESYRELVRLLIELLNESEEETSEEVDEYLREAGYDPDDMVTKLRLKMKNAMDASPLNWRNRTDQIRQERIRLAEMTNAATGDIGHLKSEINRLFSLLGTSTKLALHHRNLDVDKMSEADLAQLLGELEFQLSQRQKSFDKDADS